MRSARARFLCWLRSSWQTTTMPLGRCVIRTADSVLLTCCPPAPPARMVSTSRSSSRSSISASSASAITATVAAEVWIRPWLSVAGTRCTRCPPDSKRSARQAPSPSTPKTISRSPPTSDACSPMLSRRQRRASASLPYMRKRSAANSVASSPPVPARISTMTRRRSSSGSATSAVRASSASATRPARASVSSPSASSASSASPSSRSASASSIRWASSVQDAWRRALSSSTPRSRRSAGKRRASAATAGSSSSRESSSNRAARSASFSRRTWSLAIAVEDTTGARPGARRDHARPLGGGPRTQASFLACPYFLRKRSTRPAASTNLALPE